MERPRPGEGYVPPKDATTGQLFQRCISTREIMEELVVAELRARRMTRRGQSQLLRLARDYRLNKAEARKIIEAACDRLAAEGVVVDRTATASDGSDRKNGKLIAAAIAVITIQVLWWIW